MNTPNPQVDLFLVEGCMRCSKGATPACKVHQWKAFLEKLRQMLLESELIEERKWGVPTYTLNGKNVIMLGVFKESCVISFLKGSLMKDPEGILELPGPNSRDGRLIRFTKEEQLVELEGEIRAFIKEAIEIEKSGKKPARTLAHQLEIPEELNQKFEEIEGLKKAFYSLTPGRQRGYLIHFLGTKKSQTRINRIEKFIPKIMEGKGIMD
ncbi:YdeI/OmpD-associated family protein [Algoriphagus limi]|uniref:YdeI/OmpD-associated family protein n=1 Tax=Algoriphagus limi TaxID=2975273 RepID=A0ABT2GAC0_9BACT|nr:YdeI/OmpD-associated family protein [Algoriphagus limi]MCS5491708.1 YdeI/OmpD-associated family protein [Algoriphagus limi]